MSYHEDWEIDARWKREDKEEQQLTELFKKLISENYSVILRYGYFYAEDIVTNLIMPLGRGFDESHSFIWKCRTNRKLFKPCPIFPKYISLFW